MAADIAVIGLAVMGQNLVLNMRDHGFSISVFNRSFSKAQAFVQSLNEKQGIEAFENLQPLCQSLQKPRQLLLMVKAINWGVLLERETIQRIMFSLIKIGTQQLNPFPNPVLKLSLI